MNCKVVPNAVSAVLLPGYIDHKFSESIFLVFTSPFTFSQFHNSSLTLLQQTSIYVLQLPQQSVVGICIALND